MKTVAYPRKLVTPPAVEPVGIVELREHVNLAPDDDTFDAKLLDALRIAREYVEGLSCRQLVTASWKVYPPCFPKRDEQCEGNEIDLPLYPLQSVDSFKITDSAGDVTEWTVNGSGDLIDSDSVVRAHVDTISDPGKIVLAYNQVWPSLILKRSNPIEIKITCGYGGVNAVPGVFKAAILWHVGHQFENREAVTIGTLMQSTELVMGVRSVLANAGLQGF